MIALESRSGQIGFKAFLQAQIVYRYKFYIDLPVSAFFADPNYLFSILLLCFLRLMQFEH